MELEEWTDVVTAIVAAPLSCAAATSITVLNAVTAIATSLAVLVAAWAVLTGQRLARQERLHRQAVERHVVQLLAAYEAPVIAASRPAPEATSERSTFAVASRR